MSCLDTWQLDWKVQGQFCKLQNKLNMIFRCPDLQKGFWEMLLTKKNQEHISLWFHFKKWLLWRRPGSFTSVFIFKNKAVSWHLPLQLVWLNGVGVWELRQNVVFLTALLGSFEIRASLVKDRSEVEMSPSMVYYRDFLIHAKVYWHSVPAP